MLWRPPAYSLLIEIRPLRNQTIITGARGLPSTLFYENALIDTENAFLNFIKTHGGNVQKRTENYTETHKVKVE